MRETVWHISIILMVAGAVFFTNLGESRLWDRDEPRNAGCAAEMMARGDWVVPTFNDEIRHQKPVLLYWLIMSAYSVFGVSEFSARFWSATLAIGTTMATYGIARRLTNPRIALIAAIALSTSLMFDVAARAATPDSVLIFCSTSALLLYVLGTFRRTEDETKTKIQNQYFPENIFVLIAMYALMGLGVLAKGPVGFLLPMAIIGMFMLIERLPRKESVDRADSLFGRLIHMLTAGFRPFHPAHFLKTFWSMKPWLAAIVVLLVAAPWYVLVDHRTNGYFTQLFFVGEHFGRATTAMENHAGGFWFYPLAMLVGFFPWSIFWGPVAVSLIGQRSRYQAATRLMLCMVCVQVGVFSLAQTKLPSYVTPCYPALAILTAICLSEFSIQRSVVAKGWFYAAFAGLIFSGLIIGGGLGFAASKFMPNQIWLAALGGVPIVAGGALIWMQMKNQTRAMPSVFAVAATLFCWGLFGMGTRAVDQEQQSHLVLNKIRAASGESAVAAYGCLESSWVFYGGRPIHELTEIDSGDSDTSRISLTIASTRSIESTRRLFWEPKPRVTLDSFLGNHPGAMLITTDEHVEALKKRLPERYEVLQATDYFLKNKQIHLLGIRRDQVAQGAGNGESLMRSR